MNRAWLPWAIAAGIIAAAQPLVKSEAKKTPEVSATGKNLAGNLNGVRAVCEG